MERKEYNGWTNYETWNVALWMDNEQGSNEYWREVAEEVYAGTDEEDVKEARTRDAVTCLAARIEEAHEEAMPEVTGCFADLLGAAMQEVNWEEIAEHLLADLEVEA